MPSRKRVKIRRSPGAPATLVDCAPRFKCAPRRGELHTLCLVRLETVMVDQTCFNKAKKVRRTYMHCPPGIPLLTTECGKTIRGTPPAGCGPGVYTHCCSEGMEKADVGAVHGAIQGPPWLGPLGGPGGGGKLLQYLSTNHVSCTRVSCPPSILIPTFAKRSTKTAGPTVIPIELIMLRPPAATWAESNSRFERLMNSLHDAA